MTFGQETDQVCSFNPGAHLGLGPRNPHAAFCALTRVEMHWNCCHRQIWYTRRPWSVAMSFGPTRSEVKVETVGFIVFSTCLLVSCDRSFPSAACRYETVSQHFPAQNCFSVYISLICSSQFICARKYNPQGVSTWRSL